MITVTILVSGNLWLKPKFVDETSSWFSPKLRLFNKQVDLSIALKWNRENIYYKMKTILLKKLNLPAAVACYGDFTEIAVAVINLSNRFNPR